MQYLSIWDLVLTPFFLLVLVAIARWWRDKHYSHGHPLRKYVLPGLYAKFGGAVFIGLIYAYYYGGGDTMNYFYHAQVINSSLHESFSTWLNLLLGRSADADPTTYKYISQMFWYGDQSTYNIAIITALFGLLSGTSYIPTALIFAFFSYTGIWAMYSTFARVYPKMHKPLAYAFLFIPSTVVWGSSIFKDTVCMFALGWMTYCTFRIFIDRNFSIRNFLLLAFSFYLVVIIKVYIIMAFVPALGLWLLMTYSKKIPSAGIRWLVNIIFVGVVALLFMFVAQRFAKELNAYSLDNIAKKAKQTQDWITLVSQREEGSAYDIGKLDGTFGSMISKFPQSVNVTLYRPYLWESKKPIMVLSAVESFAFLILTLLIFYRTGVVATFRKIFKDPNLTFFLVFTLIFAFAVGVSTGNFGSLSRYKIPCMPFFAALLFILYYQSKPSLLTPKKSAHAQRPVSHLA